MWAELQVPPDLPRDLGPSGRDWVWCEEGGRDAVLGLCSPFVLPSSGRGSDVQGKVRGQKLEELLARPVTLRGPGHDQCGFGAWRRDIVCVHLCAGERRRGVGKGVQGDQPAWFAWD